MSNQNIVAKFLTAAKRPGPPVEPHVVRNAQEMVEHLQVAEAAMHKAVQFSRTLAYEPRLEWVVEQLQQLHENFEPVAKSAQEAVDYLVR